MEYWSNRICGFRNTGIMEFWNNVKGKKTEFRTHRYNYLILAIPRSLQIFLARKFPLSVCLGAEDLLFNLGFHHHE